MEYLNSQPRTNWLKSSHEMILRQFIEKDFPLLEIKSNDRSVLPVCLELDIWIPSIQMAIELNGPCHYFPIYGEKALLACKNNDNRKVMYCQKLEINLMYIDTFNMTSIKSAPTKLKTIYEEYIKPVINDALLL
jgi:hypothetical protein